MKKFNAVNWNKPDDEITKVFWDQNIRQFWVDEEIPISGDKNTWQTLPPEHKEVFVKALASLTLLDTYQGSIGMARIAKAFPSHQVKAVLSFMEFMEHMHAKSYSSIFQTICNSKEIDELFEWVQKDIFLQQKLKTIVDIYEKVDENVGKFDLYMALVASVFLESFLFYSGFYFPFYLSGRGQMVHSGEIINLIIRDEAVHGLYIGMLAQKLISDLSEEEKDRYKKETIALLRYLYALEANFALRLYKKIGLFGEVKTYMQYNANKALQNLGYDPYFKTTAEDVNPIIFKGINTGTRNHDFFSTKGNGYIKNLKVEELTDEDFKP